MKEVIEQSPSATCYVIVEPKQKRIAFSRDLLQKIGDSLLPVYLRDVMKGVETVSSMPPQTFALQRHEKADKHVIVYLDKEKLRIQGLTTIEILKHVKVQVKVSCSASSLRVDQPFVALHFESSQFDANSIEVATRGVENLLVRGYSQIYRVFVKPRFTSQHDPKASVKPLYDLHCICKDLSPFFLCDGGLFDLTTIRVGNVVVAYNTYGIESALACMFSEIKAVVTDGGTKHVNNHHIYLLSCSVCHTGT